MRMMLPLCVTLHPIVLLLPLSLLVLLLHLVPSSAQATPCIVQGYDLTSLTTSDLLFNDTTTSIQYAIRPCGVVTTHSFCTSQPGQFCRSNLTLSSIPTTGPTTDIVWGQVNVNGQYGVAQVLNNGGFCADIGYDAGSTILVLCNSSATTPYIASVTQTWLCHYEAHIQSSAICPQVPPYGFSTTPSTTVMSSDCGGGIYDLTSLNAIDITAPTPFPSGYNYVIRVCGQTTTSPCYNRSSSLTPPSICQLVNNSNPTSLAVWTGMPANPVIWQYVAPGVISQIAQNGARCRNQQPAYTNLTFVCNTTATVPVLTSVTHDSLGCSYQLVVQTNVVCGQAFAAIISLGSSTGSAGYVPSSEDGLPSYFTWIYVGMGVGAAILLCCCLTCCYRCCRKSPPPPQHESMNNAIGVQGVLWMSDTAMSRFKNMSPPPYDQHSPHHPTSPSSTEMVDMPRTSSASVTAVPCSTTVWSEEEDDSPVTVHMQSQPSPSELSLPPRPTPPVVPPRPVRPAGERLSTLSTDAYNPPSIVKVH